MPLRFSARNITVFFVISCVAICHIAYYYPFLSDDALISLRYSERLLSGHGLTYTDGEWVEGYTNLLWVLLVALVGISGLDLISAARGLDLLFAALTLIGITRLFAGRWQSAAFANILLASSAPFVVWAIGGLEQIAVGCAVVWALVSFLAVAEESRWQKQLLHGPGPALAAAVLLRADGAIFTVALTISVFLSFLPLKLLISRLIGVILLPLSCYLGQLLFRLAYYHEWLPNTAHAKVAFNTTRVLTGVSYLTAGLMAFAMISVFAVLALAKPRDKFNLAIWPSIILWLGYITLIGGDIFPAFRQFVPALPLMCILAGIGGTLFSRISPKIGWVFSLTVFILHFSWQHQHPENIRGKTERWEWDGLELGAILKRNFAEKQPLLAVDAAGALPFWSELPTLDMLGLNDKYIASHPPQGFGKGQIGHELGDGNYLWQRRPDIIMGCGARGAKKPCFYGFRQMMQSSEFFAAYDFITFRGQTGTVGQAYFLKDSPRVGILRSDDQITIPSYFFTQRGQNAVVADAEGILRFEMSPSQIAHAYSIVVPAGHWTIGADQQDATIHLGVLCDGRSALPLQTSLPAQLSLDKPQKLDFVLASQKPTSFKVVKLTHNTSEPLADHKAITCPSADESIVVAAEELSHTKAEASYWAAPGTLVFGKDGGKIKFAHPVVASSIDVSLDNNDVYNIKIFSGEKQLTEFSLGPKINGGLATYHKEFSEIKLDSIRITPVSGDGFYSLGHLVVAR